jgi:hypothetical protein
MLVLLGCTSQNRYAVPRVLPKGRVQTFGSIDVEYRRARPEYFGYPIAQDADAWAPSLPQLGGRLGLGYGFEGAVSTQLGFLGQYNADLKFQFVKLDALDVAVNLRAGFNLGVVSFLPPPGGGFRRKDYRLAASSDATLLLGLNTGRITWVLSPGVFAGLNRGGYPGTSARLGFGVCIRVSHSWGFMPEATLLAPLAGGANLAGASFGIALIGGGKHPYPTADALTTSAD